MTRLSRFTVLCLVLILAPLPAAPALAQEGVVYEDPTGLFTAPIPAGWTDASTDAFAHFVSPDGEAHAYVLTVEGDDVQASISAALALIDPAFDAELLQTIEAPLPNGTWTQNVYTLAGGEVVAALGQVRGEVAYVAVLRGPQDALVAVNNTFLQLLQGITMSVEAETAETKVYEDPAGLFSVPIPTNWTAEHHDDGYGILTSPDGGITVYVMTVESDDIEKAVSAAWAIVDPTFDLEVDEVIEEPVTNGADGAYTITYDIDYEETIILAGGWLYEGIAYVEIFRADLIAFQQRVSQLQIISTGFDIKALEKDNLTGVEPRPLDDDIIAELEAYIEDTLARFEIPGAAVAIVEGGEIVYSGGFGVRDHETGEPMTPETLMMIGSTTKTMTTMLMAQLVDEGVMQWNTPVVDILPTFAVADPEITQRITMQNLVCACTGVPRRDFELIFNSNDLTAEGVVESLADFEFFTDFGEAFQYSNQMVAAGGYVTALAAGAEYGDLYDAYLALLQERVLDPIGMSSTTFSFEAVKAGGNYAAPYGLDALSEFTPIPLTLEEAFLRPLVPAGGAWSNVLDMARYIITELNEGVAPDGARVVSAENLAHTWEPQVAITADASYGLGWIVDEYKGLLLLHHGGNTLGHTSDLAFLPDAGLGVSVLTNGRITNVFNEAVRFRLFELVYGLEPAYEETVQFVLDMQEEDDPPEIINIDPDEAAPYVGTWTNAALGEITVELSDDGIVTLDAGEFVTEVRARVNDEGETVIFMYDPPLAGLPLELGEDEDGGPLIIMGGGVNEYAFERIE
jgi:CubicO group peptidase (beta-lactamase class C family)